MEQFSQLIDRQQLLTKCILMKKKVDLWLKGVIIVFSSFDNQFHLWGVSICWLMRQSSCGILVKPVANWSLDSDWKREFESPTLRLFPVGSWGANPKGHKQWSQATPNYWTTRRQKPTPTTRKGERKRDTILRGSTTPSGLIPVSFTKCGDLALIFFLDN